MTAQEKKKMIEDLEEKWGYPVSAVSELLRSMNEEENKEVSSKKDYEIQIVQEVTNIIQNMGICANIKGYQYLREAIVLCYKDHEYIDVLTKGLYPEVAKKYKTTPSNVERGIRHAIEMAWKKRDKGVFKEYFSYTSMNSKRPSNGKFIANIVDSLHLQNDK